MLFNNSFLIKHLKIDRWIFYNSFLDINSTCFIRLLLESPRAFKEQFHGTHWSVWQFTALFYLLQTIKHFSLSLQMAVYKSYILYIYCKFYERKINRYLNTYYLEFDKVLTYKIPKSACGNFVNTSKIKNSKILF